MYNVEGTWLRPSEQPSSNKRGEIFSFALIFSNSPIHQRLKRLENYFCLQVENFPESFQLNVALKGKVNFPQFLFVGIIIPKYFDLILKHFLVPPDRTNREPYLLALQVLPISTISNLDTISLDLACKIILAKCLTALLLWLTHLYCSTQKEAKEIMKEAKEAGLTKQTCVWIITQPVIGFDLDLAPQVGSFNMQNPIPYQYWEIDVFKIKCYCPLGWALTSSHRSSPRACWASTLTRQLQCLDTPSTLFTLTELFPSGPNRRWCRG